MTNEQDDPTASTQAEPSEAAPSPQQTPVAADLPDAAIAEESAAEYEAGEAGAQYGVGPFTIREISLIAVWLVAFVVSFFSISIVQFASLWTSGLAWILTIGVPTVAVFLIVLRRLSPEGIRRVGSLGIDQFASVAFSVSAVLFLSNVWDSVAFAASRGVWVHTWVVWVELFLMAGGVVLTVLAPYIPPFDEDFAGRRDVLAHPNARPVRPVIERPRPVAPQTWAAPVAADGAVGAHETAVSEDLAAPAAEAEGPEAAPSAADEAVATDAVPADDAETAVQQPVHYQAFWALVPEERDVVDEHGTPVFRIGPTAWALVIEDRESVFVVRDEDGRIGYLHDVSNVTRG